MSDDRNEKIKTAAELAAEVASTINNLYNLMNDNFDAYLDYGKRTSEFPMYDFELRQHIDTYTMLSQRLLADSEDANNE